MIRIGGLQAAHIYAIMLPRCRLQLTVGNHEWGSPAQDPAKPSWGDTPR